MSLIHRAVPALVASALAVSLATTGSPAQADASPSSPAGHGATWLARQLNNDGLIVNHAFKPAFNDYGLTADTGFALDAIGGHRPAVRHIRTALMKHVDSYTTGADFGAPGDRYAGPLAKLLVLAQNTGGGGRAFGGVNLVHRLDARVSRTTPTKGRIEDRSGSGDNANAIGQVFAVRGLLRAHSPLARPALRFLLLQQCGRGFFRLDFRADKSAPHQACTRHSPADNDVTALAVVELWGFRKGHSALRASLHDAVGWLMRAQAHNGSFGGGGPTSAANTNSTGLAAWGLGIAGRCGAAARAASWVSRLQVLGALAGTPLARERGAVAYNHAAMSSAAKDGITTAARDQWRRATAQAAPGLLFLGGKHCR